jgi:hypothetical protein
LLVLASLIATNCPNAPFIETGFAKQLTLFATFQEGILQNYYDFLNVVVPSLGVYRTHRFFFYKPWEYAFFFRNNCDQIFQRINI